MREHIKGPAYLRLIAEAGEYLDIPSLSHRVAGDVDDLLGRELAQRVEKARGAAGAGRVDEGGFDMRTVLGESLRVQPAVGGGEADVLYAVDGGVALSVADGGRVQLNSQNLFRVPRGDDADGAYSAVCVQNGLVTAESGELYRLLIQILGLVAVYLIERRGGDDEPLAAQDVGDVSVAEEHMGLLAAEQLFRIAVDGTHGGGEIRTSLL